MRFFEKLFGKKKAVAKQNAQGMPPASADKKPYIAPGAVTKEDLGLRTVISAPESFQLERSFSDSQLNALRMGHKGGMDDKWSWFMEDDTLFICRSWTANTFCYRIDLSLNDHRHSVAVITPMKPNPEEEKAFLEELLNSGIGPENPAPEEKNEPSRTEKAGEGGEKDGKQPPAATRADWNITGMPEKNSTFLLKRTFSEAEIAALRRGNIPKAMEDKWFWFMEGDTLYAHRSWTGICVYRIDFSFADGLHKVTVNQDPEQVGITSEEEDRRVLSRLLDWWSQTEYDHYGEWITETADMLKQAGQIPKDAADYRREGIALEEQEKYEEAFLKYEEAAKREDIPSMLLIAGLYLTGKLRPASSSNLSDLLLQGGPVFPWSLHSEKRPDYKSGLEWLLKAADLGDGPACETAGSMLCSGIGCRPDTEKGIAYLEKAVENGQASAWKSICLYRPDGKQLTDDAYEECLAEFISAVDAGDDQAYALYATLKSGSPKQLARLGHVLIAAQNVQKKGYEPFSYAKTASGIPLLPVASRRRAWRTFLRFNLDAWTEEHPLIVVSADILDVRYPSGLLSALHHARIVGTATYRSPEFGWLHEEKTGFLIRLGEEDALEENALKKVVDHFVLREEEYQGGSIPFLVEDGEKEYSLEVAGIRDGNVEVLWRYTVGGPDEISTPFEPELMQMDMKEEA